MCSWAVSLFGCFYIHWVKCDVELPLGYRKLVNNSVDVIGLIGLYGAVWIEGLLLLLVMLLVFKRLLVTLV